MTDLASPPHLNSPMVSVIVPCYKQASYLPNALGSVLGQTVEDWECIIVNDGSPDDTHHVAAQWVNRDSRFRYIEKPNGGLSSARNAALHQALGTYVLFLDSDDWLERDAVSRLFEAVQGRSGVVAIMGYRDYFDADGHFATELRLPPQIESHNLFSALLSQNLMPVHCWFLERELVLECGGFDTELTSLEDWDLWLRVALREPQLLIVNEAGAVYRRTAGSMSTNKAVMNANTLEVRRRIHKALIADRSRLQRWGNELYNSEQSMYRKCVSRGLDEKWEHELLGMMHEIRSRGARGKCSFAGWLMGCVFGRYAEVVTLIVIRILQPRLFDAYAGRKIQRVEEAVPD